MSTTKLLELHQTLVWEMGEFPVLMTGHGYGNCYGAGMGMGMGYGYGYGGGFGVSGGGYGYGDSYEWGKGYDRGSDSRRTYTLF